MDTTPSLTYWFSILCARRIYKMKQMYEVVKILFMTIRVQFLCFQTRYLFWNLLPVVRLWKTVAKSFTSSQDKWFKWFPCNKELVICQLLWFPVTQIFSFDRSWQLLGSLQFLRWSMERLFPNIQMHRVLTWPDLTTPHTQLCSPITIPIPIPSGAPSTASLRSQSPCPHQICTSGVPNATTDNWIWSFLSHQCYLITLQ